MPLMITYIPLLRNFDSFIFNLCISRSKEVLSCLAGSYYLVMVISSRQLQYYNEEFSSMDVCLTS